MRPRFQLAVVVAVIAFAEAPFACKFGVDVDNSKFECQTNTDCGSGYQCWPQKGKTYGVCFPTGQCDPIQIGVSCGSDGGCVIGLTACHNGTVVCQPQTADCTNPACLGFACDSVTPSLLNCGIPFPDAGPPDAGSPDGAFNDGGDASVSDGSIDAGIADGGSSDGGNNDAGIPDGGAADGGTSDAGAADASVGDGGESDGAIADAGDAGTIDSGPADAGTADSGADSGSFDAGQDSGADAGIDAGPDAGGMCGDAGPLVGTPMCVPRETICDDCIDNDGDGLTDCADPDCDGLTCAPGKTCVNFTCQ
jgi:hypothetical protein